MAWGKPNRSRRDKYLTQRYGITETEYERMFTEQCGKCAICGRPPKTRRLAVDHNHRTKKVRQLLCSTCNYGLGWWRENAQNLENAAAYLRKHNTTT